MLTQEQFIDYVNNHLKFPLMEYQKTALWEFYKNLAADKNFVFTYGRGNGKMFIYKIMKELLEYEQQMGE